MDFSKIQVVHCKKEKDHYYIGRPSVLGNPFTHKTGTTAEIVMETREEAIAAYEKYAMTKIEQGDKDFLSEFRKLKNEFLTKGYLNLGCHCSPLGCHGDIVKKILVTSLIQMQRRIDINENKFAIFAQFDFMSFSDTLDEVHFTSEKDDSFKNHKRNSFRLDIENVPLFEGDVVEFLLTSKTKDVIEGQIIYKEEDDKWFVKTGESFFDIDKFLLINKTKWTKILI